MIVDQLFTPKLIREGQVYDLGHKSLSEALELYFGKNSRPISEGKRNNRLRLMEETTFRNGYAFARLLVEKNLTKDQVQQLFKSIETRATRMGQTGAGVSNRTGLGKAKDFTTNAVGKASKLVQDAMQWARERPTMQAVDAEYNRAMTALGKVGGENGEANAITKAIYKYRDAAKKYPRATGLAKWAIISAASLVTGGLGGVGVAAGLAAIDAAIKDKDLVDIVGSGVQAAMVSGAIQGVGDLASAASDAYNGVPSAADIAANNAALGDWNDTDIPGGPASNINGLDLPPDTAVPNIVGPEAEGLTPGELADAAAQAKAYGFDGDVTLDQLNQAIMQTAEPGTVPADYSQLGAVADTGSSTYTVTADDFKGLGKIAQDNGLTAQQLWDANPQITNPDKIFIGQEINIPAASGEPVKNVWQDWEGPTKPTAPAVEPGPGDTVPTPAPAGDPTFNKIDYSQPGPVTTDSMGQKLEYGIPVNDQGSFKAPNPGLQPEELAGQKTAYNNWLTDFKSRWPNATQLPDGSWQGSKPGLAPMQILTKPTLPAAVQESVWSKVAESVRVKVLPNNLLIDNKLTVMAWALNESTNRSMGHGVQLTKLGVRTIFENIGRYRQAYLKEYVGAPTTDYGHPTAPGAPVDATAGQSKQGWFGKTLDTIGKGVDKVAGWAGNVGHNIITKVTADKLNNAWNRAGEPYDSDKIYDFLLAQKVPKEVIDNVYQRMTLTAPAKTGGAQRQAYAGTNPATGKPWTVDELQARMQPATAAPAPASAPTDTAKPTATKTTAGGPASFNASNVMKLPGMEKYTKPAATTPAKTPNFGGPGGYSNVTTSFKTPGTAPVTPKTTATAPTTKVPTQAEKDAYLKSIGAPALPESRIATALKKPVAEMLQMVETKEDVQRIKQFVDDTFVKHGAVTESAFVVRNKIVEYVTQVGAQRRREYARKG